MQGLIRPHKSDQESRRGSGPGLASLLLLAVVLADLSVPAGRAAAAMLLSSGDSLQSPATQDASSLFNGEGFVSRWTGAGANGITPILDNGLTGNSEHRIDVRGGSGVPRASMDSGQLSLHGTGPLTPVAPAPSSANLFLLGLIGVAGVLLPKQPLLKQDMGASTSRCDPAGARQPVLVQIVAPDDRIEGFLSGQGAVSRSGYELRRVSSAADLLSCGPHRVPALILADQRVSDWDMLRTDPHLKQVPILVVVPAGSVYTDADVVEDLERGADGVHLCQDGWRLLQARIGTYLRRSGAQELRRGLCRLGAVELDADIREVKVGGERVPLSAKPFAILEAFMRSPSKVFSRRELTAIIWGHNFAIGDHTLDVHVHALRQQLARDPQRRCRLVTIKGVGFKLKAVSPATAVSVAMDQLDMPVAVHAGARSSVMAAGRLNRRLPASAPSASSAGAIWLKRVPRSRSARAMQKTPPVHHLHRTAVAG